MGCRLTKKHLIKACEKHSIEIKEKETCAEMAKKLNNHYGYQLYNYGTQGTYINTNNQKKVLSRDSLDKKDTTTIINCPCCHRDLPIAKFKDLSNTKKKYCKECRQEMGKK